MSTNDYKDDSDGDDYDVYDDDDDAKDVEVPQETSSDDDEVGVTDPTSADKSKGYILIFVWAYR